MEAGNGTEVGRRLAEFAVATGQSELPPVVAEKARCNLLHDLVSALAAHQLGAPLWETSRDRLPAEATLIADGGRVEAEQAAFANGALIHTRAQDDTHFAAKTHVGSTVFPAALAATQAEGGSGQSFLRAAVAGCEVAAAVGERMARSSTSRGFRASPLYGTLGAAAAASVAYGLDLEETSSAIALSASFSGGLNQTWIDGSGEYRIHTGNAARNGVFAARLARNGIVGARRWYEGEAGFERAFADQVDEQEWALGERWRILDVTCKPYPVCAITQSLVQAAIDLAVETDLDPGRIESLRVRLNPDDIDYPGTVNRGPFRDISATLMSAQFCAAMALTERSATLDGLTRFDDPQILRLVELTEVVADDSLPPVAGGIDLTVDGEEISRTLVPDESTYNWDWEAVVKNAERMAPEVRGGSATVEGLVREVRAVGECGSIEPLLEATVA